MIGKFQIVLMRPANFVFAEGARELAGVLSAGLTELGFSAPILENRHDGTAIPIVLGIHHMQQSAINALPPETILYNLEPLIAGYPRYTETYVSLLRRFRIWDYQRENIEHLRSSRISANAWHVPMGYMPQLSNIEAGPEDIDVLFYGRLTERRKCIVEQISERGLRVVTLVGVFGDTRDRWIARAKVVLNLHQEASGYFEAIRVFHLMANRKAVVTEVGEPCELEPGLAAGLCAVSYERLADACENLIRDDQTRKALADAAFIAIADAKRRMSVILKSVPEIRNALGAD